jgi:hypothetical protein
MNRRWCLIWIWRPSAGDQERIHSITVGMRVAIRYGRFYRFLYRLFELEQSAVSAREFDLS